jgi:hypothetical protein
MEMHQVFNLRACKLRKLLQVLILINRLSHKGQPSEGLLSKEALFQRPSLFYQFQFKPCQRRASLSLDGHYSETPLLNLTLQ